MVQSQYALSWESYVNNICNGFSSLQQNGELVDMTLAADGHLVKVHQVLMALASPYLKELITSVPCQHPVIYLNNVSHNVLSLLLEYIYTGEVVVPSDSLQLFIKTAKDLHIKGLDSVASSVVLNESSPMPKHEIHNLSERKPHQTFMIDNTNHLSQSMPAINLPSSARNISNHQPEEIHIVTVPTKKETEPENVDEYQMDFLEGDLDNESDEESIVIKVDQQPMAKKKVSSSNAKQLNESSMNAATLQFSVSNRGAMQIILNRYIYNLHSSSKRDGIKRWRCVEYRNHKCAAYVITKENVVVGRANVHSHAFHDKKILDKIDRGVVYSAISDIEHQAANTGATKVDTTIETEDFGELDS